MERVPVSTAKIQLPILSMGNEQQYLSSLSEGLSTPTSKRTQCKLKRWETKLIQTKNKDDL